MIIKTTAATPKKLVARKGFEDLAALADSDNLTPAQTQKAAHALLKFLIAHKDQLIRLLGDE